MRVKLAKMVVLCACVAWISPGPLWGQHATATLTIGGTEQRQASGAWPSGDLYLTVNGQTEKVSYGQFSTPSSIAAGFAAKFSSDPTTAVPRLCTQGLCAKANGPQIIFEAVEQLLPNPTPIGFNSPFTLDSSQWPQLPVGPVTMPYGSIPRDGLWVKLVSMASQLCLDDRGGQTYPGDAAQEYTCNALTPQNWQLHDMHNGYFSLQNQNSQLCLDDPSGNTAPNTLLQQYTCNGLSPQNWLFANVGNGYYTLQNQAAGLMLDDTNWSTMPGTQLQLYTYNGLPPQLWEVVPSGQQSGTLSLSCTPSSVSQGSTASCTATAPTGSVGNVQFSIDDVTWTSATLQNDNAVVSGALAGAAPGSHLILASTTQAGTLLTALATVNVVSSSTPASTIVYAYSITTSTSNPLANPTATDSGYLPNGDIAAYTDSVNGSWTLGYDSLRRLGSATQTFLGSNVTQYDCWQYDSFGNRLVQAASSQQMTVGSCMPASGSNSYYATWMQFNDGTNHITGRGTINASGQSSSLVAPVYDPSGNGNLVEDGSFRYVYDAEGHLCAAYTSQGMIGYIYDAEGHRVAKGTISQMSCDPTTNGFVATTVYVLGPGGEAMTEVDGGGWSHTDVFAAGEQIATYDQNGIHFQLADWLGTRRVQTNYAGIPENQCSNSPFGDNQNCINTALDISNRHFTGKQRDDESGLDYFGARYYASTMGRFLTPDWSSAVKPIPYADLANPQTLNLYSYVVNDVIVSKDADGHCAGHGAGWGGYGSGCAEMMVGEANWDSGEPTLVDQAEQKRQAAQPVAQQNNQNLSPTDKVALKAEQAALGPTRESVAEKNSHEYGGLIVRNNKDGRISSTDPVRGKGISIDVDSIPVPTGTTVIATYHSHPHLTSTEDGGASQGDVNNSKAHNNRTGYEMDSVSGRVYRYDGRTDARPFPAGTYIGTVQ